MRAVATTMGEPGGGQSPSRDLSAAGGFSRVLGMISRLEAKVLYPT